MELDASNGSVFRIACLIEELARYSIDSTNFGATGRIIITKLVEIVLEHIDDFVGLQLALNARRHTVDEVIQLLAESLVVFQGVGCLTDEVLRIVAGDSIHTSVIVGLSLNVDHFVSCLKTDFELLPVEQIRLSALFLERFKIVGALTGLLVNELTIVVVTELAALHSDARLDQRSNHSKERLTSVGFIKISKSGYNGVVTPGKSDFQPTFGS